MTLGLSHRELIKEIARAGGNKLNMYTYLSARVNAEKMVEFLAHSHDIVDNGCCNLCGSEREWESPGVVGECTNMHCLSHEFINLVGKERKWKENHSDTEEENKSGEDA